MERVKTDFKRKGEKEKQDKDKKNTAALCMVSHSIQLSCILDWLDSF